VIESPKVLVAYYCAVLTIIML